MQIQVDNLPNTPDWDWFGIASQYASLMECLGIGVERVIPTAHANILQAWLSLIASKLRCSLAAEWLDH